MHDTDLLIGLTATVLQDVITDAPAITPGSPPINRVGDRVPNVPRFTSNVYAQYGMNMYGWDSTARLEYSYVGDSFSDFYQKSNEHYVKQGDYGLVNLRFNFNKGPYRLGRLPGQCLQQGGHHHRLHRYENPDGGVCDDATDGWHHRGL